MRIDALQSRGIESDSNDTYSDAGTPASGATATPTATGTAAPAANAPAAPAATPSPGITSGLAFLKSTQPAQVLPSPTGEPAATPAAESAVDISASHLLALKNQLKGHDSKSNTLKAMLTHFAAMGDGKIPGALQGIASSIVTQAEQALEAVSFN